MPERNHGEGPQCSARRGCDSLQQRSSPESAGREPSTLGQGLRGAGAPSRTATSYSTERQPSHNDIEMQEIAIIPIGEAGRTVAARLKSEIQRGDLQQSWRKRRLSLLDRCMVKDCWNDFDAFVFIGAMGICVRTISPLIEDKHNDPAVICIDGFGRHVISVLSGHIGGANDLTRDFSEILKGHAVITTQSDMAGLWALDTLANQFGWRERHSTGMNRCIFSFVNRRPTALFMDIRDEGTDYLESTLPEHVTVIDHLEDAIRMDYALIIIVSPRIHAAMENYKGTGFSSYRAVFP